MEPLTGNTISSKRVHNGQRISLRVDEYSLGDRAPVQKEIIEHPGSVVILPVTDDGQILLVRQWRQAIREVVLEAPSGTREPGEDPLTTAHRELREETGFEAGSMTPIGGSWVAPGYSTEFTYAYLARDLRENPLPQDAGEDIQTVSVPVEKIGSMIRDRELQDQMTIAVYHIASTIIDRTVSHAPPR